MGSKKKSKVKTKKMLVLRDGREFAFVGKKGRFYVCEGTSFLKSNPEIAEIREVSATEPDKEVE